MYVDHFGFIPEQLDLLFEGGQIRTILSPHEASSWLNQHANREGYLYPPIMHWWRGNPEGKPEKIEGGEYRPLLHRLPATDELRLFDGTEDKKAMRFVEGGFWLTFWDFFWAVAANSTTGGSMGEFPQESTMITGLRPQAW